MLEVDAHAVRTATPADIDTVAVLAAQRRRRLASWEPEFWHSAADADILHRDLLGTLLAADATRTLVVVDADDRPLGFCAEMPQQGPRGPYVCVDDVCVAEGRWTDLGTALLAAVDTAPAVMCVPCADIEMATSAIRAGYELSAHCRLRRLRPVERPARPRSTKLPSTKYAPPLHTFGSVDPRAPGSLTVTDRDGSHVVGSASLPAPPVYDPGGTTCVVDRVVGPTGPDLLEDVCALASRRGDVHVVVVHSAADVDLDDGLAVRGWGEPFADIYVRS